VARELALDMGSDRLADRVEDALVDRPDPETVTGNPDRPSEATPDEKTTTEGDACEAVGENVSACRASGG